jgi:hypothetical protein
VRATDRLLAILDAELTLDDVKALAPAHRRRLAALLHHWWKLTEGPRPPGGRVGTGGSDGVLARLQDGERAP